MNPILRRANKRVSLGGAATLLIVVALFGQILGFLRNRLISTNFTIVDPGSSDAFFAAFLIPDFFYYTIAAGALGVAFMPFIADKVVAGNKKAIWDLTSSLINVLAIAMSVVAVIILVFAQPLINTIAPNLPPEHMHQAVTIMRLLALNPLFFTISGIITSVQQTYGRFFFYAVSPLLYNVAIIASVYLFKDSLGIVGLGIGAVVGGLLQLLVACLGLIGMDFKYHFKISWRSADFRKVLRQLPPRSLDQGIDQVNSIVEVNRAQTLGTGPISYYNYALTLHNVPIMLLGTSIATAAFPRLVERLSQKRPDLFRRDFLNILRTMIWMTMPVIVVSFFARAYLARLIFGDVAPEVALIFGYLVMAIFFRIVYAMLSRYFYAQKDTKTPLFVSIFAITLNIYLAFKLVHPGSYGIAGLALAQSIVAFSEVMILGMIMLYRDRKLFDAKFWGAMVKIISVTGFSLVAAFIMISILPLSIADKGIVTLASKLSAISAVTLLTHVSISLLFGLDEAISVSRKLKEVVLKPVRIQ